MISWFYAQYFGPTTFRSGRQKIRNCRAGGPTKKLGDLVISVVTQTTKKCSRFRQPLWNLYSLNTKGRLFNPPVCALLGPLLVEDLFVCWCGPASPWRTTWRATQPLAKIALVQVVLALDVVLHALCMGYRTVWYKWVREIHSNTSNAVALSLFKRLCSKCR